MFLLRRYARRPSPSMVVALIALLLASGGVAYADIPHSTTGVIDGCYANRTGALRVIDREAGETCNLTKEMPLSWNGLDGATLIGSACSLPDGTAGIIDLSVAADSTISFTCSVAQLAITPDLDQWDFGIVDIGSQSLPITFTVTNTGGVTSGAVTFVVSGFPFGSFLILDSSTCVSGTTTLAAGGTCTLDVTFAPVDAGLAFGTLSVTAVPGGGGEVGLVGSASV